MSDDMEKYSQQLRQLVDEYYHQQLTVEEYRAHRKLLFDEIEIQLVGSNPKDDAGEPDPLEADGDS